MKSLKQQADPNCPTCKGTGQDTTTTGFTCICDCVGEPSSGLSEEAQPLRLKQYGVNDVYISGPGLSLEIFQKRMGRLMTTMKEYGIKMNFITEIPKEAETCAAHKKEIAGITDMKVLAEMIGDLHYETLGELFDYLANKLARDAINDAEAGRYSLATELHAASHNIHEAFNNIESAWKISKPYMNESSKPSTNT